MKTTFSLVEIKDDLDKLRLQLAVCGANSEAEKNSCAFDHRISVGVLDACIDIIPTGAMLIKIAEEGITLNTLLIPAGRVKEGGPLMGYLIPAPKDESMMTGVFTAVENAFDLSYCFPVTGDYTAYVDNTVLRDGSAAWPLQETASLGGQQKFFTLTKDGEKAVLEISS